MKAVKKMEYVEFDVNKVELPEWLSNLLPEARKPYFIDYDEETAQYVILSPTGEKVEEFDNLLEAHDRADHLDSENDSSGGKDINANAPEVKENDIRGKSMITIEQDDSKFLRMLFFTNDDTKIRILKYSYGYWQNTVLPHYRKNPSDFMASWHFLDSHPAFWTKSPYDNNRYSWETSGYAQSMWHVPSVDDEGTVYHMMEAGASVPPNHTEHYHDLRLDVFASSYEEAVVETAALVDKFFHSDGTERKNVEYEKSDLELILEDRIDDLEESGFYAEDQ